MDISVIIPIFNTGEYLTDCLNSVKRNIAGLTAEVLLIDDGSTDNSASIAKTFAERETEFHYYRTENRGQSCARNYGVSLATGKYLFFMDSDDLLIDGILLKMFLVAEENKTDLTICNVCKMKEKSFSVSPIHVRAFYNLTGNVTHIKSHPALAYDSTSTNKLIVRSFYVKNGFLFPEGFKFEDMPAVTRMHYCANAVSVIRSVGYIWRIRTGTSKSTSQQYLKRENLTDKIEMLKRLLCYIDENVQEPEVKKAVMSKALNIDFEGYYDRLRIMKREDALEYVELIAGFVEKFIEKDALKRIPLKYQQLYYDLLNRDLDHLLRVINYKNANYARVPIVQDADDRLKMLLPSEIFTIENRDITYEFAETPPNCYLDFVEIKGSTVSIKGHVYFRRVDTLPGDQRVETILVNDISGAEIILDAKPVESIYQTIEQGILMNFDDYRNYHSNYDGTGFQIDIDFKKFPYAQKWNGDNVIILKFSNRIRSGACIFTGVRPEARRSLENFKYQGKNYEVRIRFDRQNAINIIFDFIIPVSRQQTGLPPKACNFNEVDCKQISKMQGENIKLKLQLIKELKENEELTSEKKKLQSKITKELKENEKLISEKKKLQSKITKELKENEKLISEKKKLQSRNASLQKSWSYRTGRLVTWLPRKVRDFLKK